MSKAVFGLMYWVATRANTHKSSQSAYLMKCTSAQPDAVGAADVMNRTVKLSNWPSFYAATSQRETLLPSIDDKDSPY